MIEVHSKQALADSMGVQRVTIDQWIREGMPVISKGGPGKGWKFDLTAVIRWYGDRREAAVNKQAPTDERELKLRKLAANAEMAELELAVAKKDVAPISEIEMIWTRKMAIIRANVMNVPQRVVVQLLGETDESEFKKKLKAELTLALVTATETDVDLDDEGED